MATRAASPTVPITRPYVGEEEVNAAAEPIRSGWLAQGQLVAKFERLFAERVGVSHAVATTSCTTALHLALHTLGIGPGDEVVLPAFTFVATANAVRYEGARPVFVDIDPATFTMNVAALPRAISSRTKVIIPVHLFGLCADMDPIQEIAVRHGLEILEDAACAIGSTYKGQQAGSFGMAAFSLHARKLITTGEGGMLTTQSSPYAERLRSLRTHGAAAGASARHEERAFLQPDFTELGYNYRLTDVQAAIGVAQMAKLDEIIRLRRDLAERYDGALADLPGITLPTAPNDYGHTYQSYVLMVEDSQDISRDELAEALLERGIDTRQGTHAVHTLSVYKEAYGFTAEEYPYAARADRQSLAIPLFPSMTHDEQDRVIDSIREAVHQ